MIPSPPTCRACGTPLHRTFVDLGHMPLSNAYLEPEQLEQPEPTYPLHVRVCDHCLLVQIDQVVPPEEIFSDYAYFSSFSDSWVEHARLFAEEATERFRLGPDSLVVEVASNDGYLLRHFVDLQVPVLGIEPATNVAEVALAAGVPTDVRFFNLAVAGEMAAQGQQADLIVGNNVLAHNPQLNDFVAGLAVLLKPSGVISVEVPHLLELIEGVQFDTIYHEHFSYFSLAAAEWVLRKHALRVFDVQRLPTHGGSLRLLICHSGDPRPEEPGVDTVRALEREAGLHAPDGYEGFAERVEHCRRSLLGFLAVAKKEGKAVVAYGAAAKGNTLLNYCDVTADDIRFVADRSPHKQGRYMPGSRLPIRGPEAVDGSEPDYLVILPWNLADEISEQMKHVRGWGGRFVVPIPEVSVEP